MGLAEPAELLGVGLALVAAVANAGGSVLQRTASRHRSATGSWASVRELLSRPAWTAGILAHVAGFVARHLPGQGWTFSSGSPRSRRPTLAANATAMSR